MPPPPSLPLSPPAQFAKAAASLKESGIRLANVDATEATELATRFGVQGFPTLKYFRGGAEAADYSGPRDAAGIEAWLRKRAGPATTAVSSSADVEAAVARAGAGGVVFLAFADSADAPRDLPKLVAEVCASCHGPTLEGRMRVEFY